MAVLLFDQAALSKAIADVLPLIPHEHTSAIIGTFDTNGVQAVISVSRPLAGGVFTASGVLRHTWAGDNIAGGSVIWSI